MNDINIAQIYVQAAPKGLRYSNGLYVAAFLDALAAIAINIEQGATLRVLLFILSTVDHNNHVIVNCADIAKSLHINRATVHKSVKVLVKMNVLCQDRAYRGNYTINIINPRVAYRGNTFTFFKNSLPEIVSATTGESLIPEAISFPTIPGFTEPEDKNRFR